LSAPFLRASVPELHKKLQTMCVHTHISEIHDSELAEARHDLAANLVGDVKLSQGHVRRAEHGVLGGHHGGGLGDETSGLVRLSRRLMGGAIVEMMVDGELPQLLAMMRTTCRSLAP